MSSKEQPKAMHIHRTAKDWIFDVTIIVLFSLFTFICVFPFYYLLINTVSDNDLVTGGYVNFIPLVKSVNGTGVLGSDPYIRCGILGNEERIHIDLALSKTAPLSDALDLELNLGVSLINTKVKDNLIEVGGGTWSILDVWDGQSPDYGVGSYEYINQGGIGYGVFMSALVSYSLPGMGAIKAGYTCYQAKTVLHGGTAADGSADPYTAWGWQHMLGIRFEMNNFSFIK